MTQRVIIWYSYISLTSINRSVVMQGIASVLFRFIAAIIQYYCSNDYHTIYTILYILYYTILYHTILYYTIPYHTILYYTILYYTILYTEMLYITFRYSMICMGGGVNCVLTLFGIIHSSVFSLSYYRMAEKLCWCYFLFHHRSVFNFRA